MNAEQAKELDHFVCSNCASDMDVKKSRNTVLPNGKDYSSRGKNHPKKMKTPENGADEEDEEKRPLV